MKLSQECIVLPSTGTMACWFLTRIFWISEPELFWILSPACSQFCAFTFGDTEERGDMYSPEIFQLSRKNKKKVKVFWKLFWNLWFWKWEVPRGVSCQAEPILSVNSLCYKESFHVPLSLWEKSISYFSVSIIHVGHRATKKRQVEMYLLHSSQSCYCFNLNICPVGIKAGRWPLWNAYINADTRCNTPAAIGYIPYSHFSLYPSELNYWGQPIKYNPSLSLSSQCLPIKTSFQMSNDLVGCIQGGRNSHMKWI